MSVNLSLFGPQQLDFSNLTLLGESLLIQLKALSLPVSHTKNEKWRYWIEFFGKTGGPFETYYPVVSLEIVGPISYQITLREKNVEIGTGLRWSQLHSIWPSPMGAQIRKEIRLIAKILQIQEAIYLPDSPFYTLGSGHEKAIENYPYALLREEMEEIYGPPVTNPTLVNEALNHKMGDEGRAMWYLEMF